jgi:hypothetical protein
VLFPEAGHPGQYGFLLRPTFFRSEAHLAALLERPTKAKK